MKLTTEEILRLCDEIGVKVTPGNGEVIINGIQADEHNIIDLIFGNNSEFRYESKKTFIDNISNDKQVNYERLNLLCA